jgi:hypothetical protein
VVLGLLGNTMPKKKIYTANIGFHFTGTVDIHATSREDARKIAKGMGALIGHISHINDDEDVIDWNVSTHCDNITLGQITTKY